MLRAISGKRWYFFHRDDIPDIFNPEDIYLTRWRIIQTPWGGIFLHAIRRPDGDRALHDHPWSFISLVLKGGYVEILPDRVVSRLQGSITRRRAEDQHRISILREHPTWTLLLVGPRRRDWGFYVDGGWVRWEQYIANVTNNNQERN